MSSVSQDKLPTSEGSRLYFPRETTKQIQIMSNLQRIFTPTNKDGSLDHRFKEDIEWVFNRVGNEVLEGLEKFRQETETVNINYAKYAYSLAKAFFERNSEIDLWEVSTPANQYKWRSKKISKSLQPKFQEIGFKKSVISKIIGAAELIHSLEKKLKEQPKNKRIKEQLEHFESFPLSSQYVLNTMNANGLDTVIALSARREWNRETDTYDPIPLTKKDLEEIQREYPKNPNETRGKNKAKSPTTLRLLDEPSKTTTEAITEPKTNYERLHEWVLLAKAIDTEDAYQDELFHEILQESKKEITRLYHLAITPIPTPQSSTV